MFEDSGFQIFAKKKSRIAKKKINQIYFFLLFLYSAQKFLALSYYCIVNHGSITW